jgi:hypothetical protein
MVAVSQQMINFSMEMGMLIIALGQVFSHKRESYQQLRGKNLLVTGCCI